MEFHDDELLDLVCENSEEARDELYDKYHYIVDIILKKYRGRAYYLDVDPEELQQEALLGFSDALYNYDASKDSSLPTFITICVERRLCNYLRKADTVKTKLMREAVSFDMELGDESKYTLFDTVGNDKENPSNRIEEKEAVKELREKIVDLLSPTEFEIYQLLVNGYSIEDAAEILGKSTKQVYNTLYRLRQKIRDLL